MINLTIKKLLKLFFLLILLPICLGVAFFLFSYCCLALSPHYNDYDIMVLDQTGRPVSNATIICGQRTDLNIFGDILPSCAYRRFEKTDDNGHFKGRIWLLGSGDPELFFIKPGYHRTRFHTKFSAKKRLTGRTILFPDNYHVMDPLDPSTSEVDCWDLMLKSPDGSLSIPGIDIDIPDFDIAIPDVKNQIGIFWDDSIMQYVDQITGEKLPFPELLQRISSLTKNERSRIIDHLFGIPMIVEKPGRNK